MFIDIIVFNIHKKQLKKLKQTLKKCEKHFLRVVNENTLCHKNVLKKYIIKNDKE